MGGLARAASVVDGMRKAGAPVLLVDVGDLALPEGSSLGGNDVAIGRGKATVAYRALGAMGAAAHVPGELDLALGVDFVRQAAAAANVPVLAGNLLDGDGEPLFPASRVVELAGVRILVVGVVDPSVIGEDLRALGLSATDPAAAAAEAIEAHEDVDLVVAAGHLDEGIEAQLLAAVPRIDVLVAGHGGSPMPGGRPGGNGVLFRAAGKGRFLGRVDLLLGPGFRPGARFENGAARKQAGAALAEAKAVLAELTAALGGKQPHEAFADDPARRFRFAEAASRAAEAEEELSRFRGRSLFAATLLPLGPELPDHPAVAAEVAAWKRGELRAFRAVAAAAPPMGPVAPYAGVGPCVACHPVHVSQWQGTPHAHAYETLVAKGAEFNPSCVGCHTVGRGEPGGYLEPQDAPGFAGVQCESCHGPSLAHAQGGPPPPKTAGEPLCVRCHTPENDDHWDHAAKLPAIRHWGEGFPTVR